MNDRAPIFVLLSGAIPLGWFAFLIVAMIANNAHPTPEGGTPGDIGAGIRSLFLSVGVSAFLGLAFACISLCRHERWRPAAWLSFGIYALPGLLGVVYLTLAAWDTIRGRS
jgi:hypothetical protein